jgi:23S rRNA (guanosine2251-2'-O)-methyltransferase
MKHRQREHGRPAPRREQRPPRRNEREEREERPIIYGLSPVLEALRAANRRIEKVMIAQGVREHRVADVVDECRARSIAFEWLPRELFARLVDDKANHQGVVAQISAAGYVDTDEILDNAGNDPLLVVLDGVEDPRNLGAILRVVECAGADGVFIPERRAVGLTDVVAKSSAGAVEYVKVAKVQNLNRLIEELKARDIWIVGASGDAPASYQDWDWTRPTALVMGGEGTGLHRLVAENCDALVRIPMYGKIDSLNVSVATGVILFEARRQRESHS